MSYRRRSIPILLALLAFPAGCGDRGSGDGGSGTGAPTGREIFLVQNSSEASGAVSEVVEAANAGILASAEASSAPGPHAVPVFPGATPAFDFEASVDLLFDFDALDPEGNDRFPDASGQIHVTATGTKTGDPSSGNATFVATIEVEEAVVFTNPETAVETTIPVGAAWSYELAVEWSATDNQNWTVTATATTLIDLENVTVDDGTTVKTVAVSGERQVISTVTRAGGKPERERSFEGSLTTTVDDGTTTESVVIEFNEPGKVRISVLGHVFGPMTEGQVRALFKTVIK